MLSFLDLISLLERQKAIYEIIEHAIPVLIGKDAAIYFDIERTVFVLIMDTEKGLYVFYRSLKNGRFNVEVLKEHLKLKKLKLASKEKIEKTIRYRVGSIPLIGHGLPCFFDATILKYNYIWRYRRQI